MNTADNEDNNVVSEGFVLYIKSEKIVTAWRVDQRGLHGAALLLTTNESSLTLKRKSSSQQDTG